MCTTSGPSPRTASIAAYWTSSAGQNDTSDTVQCRSSRLPCRMSHPCSAIDPASEPAGTSRDWRR